MTTWDVLLLGGTVQRIAADRYVVNTKMYGNMLTFYRGHTCVATFKEWIGFTTVDSTEVK